MVKETAPINLLCDISECKFEQIITEVCAKEGISKADIKAVLYMCSLPCETFSHGDASNMSRDHHDRDHSQPEKPPRSLEGCTTEAAKLKREKAIQHDNMAKNVLASFFRDRRNGFMYDLVIENPVGAMRSRPYMRGEQVETALQRTTADYCAYDKSYSPEDGGSMDVV